MWDLLGVTGRRVEVQALGNKRIAVDASIWVIQVCVARHPPISCPLIGYEADESFVPVVHQGHATSGRFRNTQCTFVGIFSSPLQAPLYARAPGHCFRRTGTHAEAPDTAGPSHILSLDSIIWNYFVAVSAEDCLNNQLRIARQGASSERERRAK